MKIDKIEFWISCHFAAIVNHKLVPLDAAIEGSTFNEQPVGKWDCFQRREYGCRDSRVPTLSRVKVATVGDHAALRPAARKETSHHAALQSSFPASPQTHHC